MMRIHKKQHWRVSWRVPILLILPIAFWVMFASTQMASADAPLEGTSPAQWRIVWAKDPATTALVAWNTADEGSTHCVEIGIRGDASQPRRSMACQHNGQYSGDTTLFYHHLTLDDLAPETEYSVVMISDGIRSPELYFKTAPEDSRALSLIYGGDSRSDRDARREVNTMIGEMFTEGEQSEDEADEIFAFAHGGDYILSGNNLEQWSAWMSDHELTSSSEGRMLPIIPARGNHDGGPNFNQIFGFEEENPENYYAVNLAPSVRFITLNTETDPEGAQREWLEAELEASRAAHTWVLAQYHRPAYPAVKRPSVALEHWVPLFEAYNLDLVCEADGHCMKRTLPIRNDEHDETGIVYIGEGGLGVQPRQPKTDRWYVQEPGMVSHGHHVQVITFSEEELVCRIVRLGGEIADTYRRAPRE